MAQYFYDLSVCDPRGGMWPALLRGFKEGTPNSALTFGPTIGNGGSGFLFSTNRNTAVNRAVSVGVSSTDVDVVVKFSRTVRTQMSTFSNTGGVAVFVRGSDFVNNSHERSSIFACLNGNTSIGLAEKDLRIFKRTDGVNTQLAVLTNALPAISAAGDPDVLLRLSAVGATIRAKVWLESSTEPGWQITATDTSVVSGDVGIHWSGYGGHWVSYWLGVGTDGSEAPRSYPDGNRIVAGTVYMPNDMKAVGYVVRCYHQDTGYLLGETLTGGGGEFSFSLPLPETEMVYCVAVDQLGRTMAAPIADRFAPVAPI